MALMIVAFGSRELYCDAMYQAAVRQLKPPVCWEQKKVYVYIGVHKLYRQGVYGVRLYDKIEIWL